MYIVKYCASLYTHLPEYNDASHYTPPYTLYMQ